MDILETSGIAILLFLLSDVTIVTYLVYIDLSYFHIDQGLLRIIQRKFCSDIHSVGFCCGEQVQFMLDMICDIKNNKRRPKDDPAHHIRLKKWLQKVSNLQSLIPGS